MEVLLKKTKITPSIIKQAQIKTYHSLPTINVLGWCICDKRKYIVIHENGGLVFKLPLFEKITPYSSEQKGIGAKIHFDGNYVPWEYQFETDLELSEFTTTILEIKKQAISKGQFYI